ncbi:20698_t:CDS:2, partial [Gigaspora margarita]
MYKNNKCAWIKSDIWEKWLTFHDKDFCIQNKKVLLIVDNARSYSEPKMPASSDDNRDQRSEDNKLGSKYENSKNFISEGSENNEIPNSESDKDSQSNFQSRGRTRGRTRGSTRGSTRRRTHGRTHKRTRRRPCGRARTILSHNKQNSTSSKFKLTNIKLYYLPPNTTVHLQPLDAGIIRLFKSKYKNLYCKHVLNQFESNINLEDEVEMEITNQESKSDFLDDEVAEIIIDLSSSDDPKASNIAQIMERYVQIVEEPVAMEGMLNDKEIITIVQANENEQEQESDDDKEPSSPPVIAKEVYNAIQTILQYEEQTNSESNLELAELEFLRKLNNNYRRAYK